MENTYTVDTNVPTETLTDNLTSDEVDSLKVGEEIAEQQDQLLAGKYKDAAELEKAYKELEAKLGEQETETEQAEPEEITVLVSLDIKTSESTPFIDIFKLAGNLLE